MPPDAASLLAELHRLADPVNVKGMARFGIVGKNLLGVSVGQIRTIAKRVGHNHAVAGELWASGMAPWKVWQ